MKKLKLLLAFCALLLGVSSSYAQVILETDLTSQFSSLTNKDNWIFPQPAGNPGYTASWACPEVDVNGGIKRQVIEHYMWSCTQTGDIFYTTVTGLTAGTYKIELYGGAAFTFGRGFGSTAFTGDLAVETSNTYNANDKIVPSELVSTGVSLCAESEGITYGGEIPIFYATSFPEGAATVVLNNVVVGASGSIKIGMKKTSTSTNWHVIQLKGVTATVNAEELFASFKSEAEALYGIPMNAIVLSELQTAANVDLNSAGANEYETAIEVLQTKIAAANTSIDNYAEAKDILDASNDYDAAGQASYAADETIAAIQTAYTNRTLEVLNSDQKTAAKTALIIACKAQVQPNDNCNMTLVISNPSFEDDFDGWTNNNMAIQNNISFAKDGNKYVEKWQPDGTFAVAQTINVPAGVYRLSAKCLARDVTSAKIYGGSEETAITIEDVSNTYSVDFNCAEKTTIGFEGVGSGKKDSWLCVDNFQLTYVRQLTDEELLVVRKANYDDALDVAKAFDQTTIPTAAKTNLQTVINDNTLISGNASDYYAATTALLNVVATAQTLVDPYAEYLETKEGTVTMKDADTYTGTDAKSILEDVINTTASHVEAAASASVIESETADLVTAAKTFVKTVTIKADQCLDITCMITNQHFRRGGNANATGWTLESGSVGERRAETHNFEAWHRKFNLSQTIKYLPKGTYKVTLQGFARHDDANVTDKTNLYCGIVNQKIKDINDEFSTTSLISGKPNMGDSHGESKSDDKYRPNGMSASYYFFQEINPETNQFFYTNEVQTLITEDGDLKIGFKCETTTDWVIWDNFHLYYYGAAISVTIDEDASVSYSEDIDEANVTFNRTIKADTWNSFVVPFDIDNTTLKAKFGNDVEVAEYSEVADGNNSSISFDKMATPAISANIPVLLKTSTAGTTYTFNGVKVKAGNPIKEGANFDFAGSYAAKTFVTTGNYYISSNKLYKSAKDDGTYIKGTRAYVKAKANQEARIVNFVIDDKTTGIFTINANLLESNRIFDLQGRRVMNPVKGLYIKNGKKAVVK